MIPAPAAAGRNIKTAAADRPEKEADRKIGLPGRPGTGGKGIHMKKKMIIIGATGSAYKRTIPALRDSEICEVTAIQGRNEEKLKKTCGEYGIGRYYLDAGEMLEKEEYDLIYIANPPFLHKEMIEKCAKMDAPIICEKPLARNHAEGMEIGELLAAGGRPFMVAHHLRHQQAFSDIKKIIASGEIGTVASGWGQWGFAINPEAPSSAWKLNKELGGGGTFSDNGIHVVDFILGLFGEPERAIGVSRLDGFKESFGNETMLLLYGDKDIAVHSSHTLPSQGNHLLLYGTKGCIEIFGGMSEKCIRRMDVTTGDGKRTIEYPEENLYKNEVEDFIRHYLEGETDACRGTTLPEAIAALRLIDEIRGA